MHSQIDLDPTHGVIRLTVLEEIVSLECAEDCYRQLSQVASSGGPYAAIYDLSMAKGTTIPTEMVREFARRRPPMPKGEAGKARVVVGEEAAIYGLARLFQICEEDAGETFDVVHTLEEAYETSRIFLDEAAFQIEAEAAYAAIKPAILMGGAFSMISSANRSWFEKICRDTSDN